MSYLDITIEDHVVPQLFTSALEAYEIGESIKKKKRPESVDLMTLQFDPAK
jgi:hypothetical protein